jgi:hypothetical protein
LNRVGKAGAAEKGENMGNPHAVLAVLYVAIAVVYWTMAIHH